MMATTITMMQANVLEKAMQRRIRATRRRTLAQKTQEKVVRTKLKTTGWLILTSHKRDQSPTQENENEGEGREQRREQSTG